MPACRQCLFQQVKSDCLKIDPKWRTFPDHHECFWCHWSWNTVYNCDKYEYTYDWEKRI